MPTNELDGIIIKLLPQVLADRDLGDGRVFTRLHLNNLWALTCLYAGECYDEKVLARRVPKMLPPNVLLAREVAAQ